MTHPQALWENTRLAHKAYPYMLFDNRCPESRMDQNILFLHWHEHFEIIIMQQGSAVIHIDSRPYEVEPGDVLFVPAGGLHVGYSRCNGDIRFMSIVFNGMLFNDWSHDAIHMEFVAPYVELNADCTMHYVLLEQIMREFEAKQPGYPLVIKSHLHMLFTQLARALLPYQSEGRAGSESQHHLSRERFKPLLRQVEERYAERWKIEQAAKVVSLNPYHFCKMFKKLTGRTFVEYVNLCRMNEAERLLRDTTDSVTEIAGQVGCDNPNYFTKLYKQYKGVTPSQVRR
jgi:AraC-like DNA-binding protein